MTDLRIPIYGSAHDNNVLLPKNRILLRKDRQPLPQDQKDLKLLPLFHFTDGLSIIELVNGQLHDLANIELTHVQETTLFLILFYETGTDNTSGEVNPPSIQASRIFPL